MLETILYFLILITPLNYQDDGMISIAAVDSSFDVQSVCDDCVNNQYIMQLEPDNNHALYVTKVIKHYCKDCEIELYGSYLNTGPYLDTVGQSIALFNACRSHNDIINYSMSMNRPVRVISAIVNYCHKNNKLIVAASGNYSDNKPRYPCAYPGVICIGSLQHASVNPHPNTTNNGFVDFYQSHTYLLDDGTVISGSSFATAMATGRIYRIWSKYPFLTAEELQKHLIKNMLSASSSVHVINDSINTLD